MPKCPSCESDLQRQKEGEDLNAYFYCSNCKGLYTRSFLLAVEMRKPTVEQIAKAWTDFVPKVPLSYIIACRNAIRKKWGG